jgi:hypothetical protein
VSEEDEPCGVLVLRAWVHDHQVIARVRAALGDEEIHDAAVGVGVEPIVAMIREWLGGFVGTER